MVVTAYYCADDPRKIKKTLTSGLQVNVTVKEPLDVMDPVFYVNYNSELESRNYLQAMGRSYFMRAETEPGGAMRLRCWEDVLYSNYAGILAAECICARNVNKWDMWQADNRFKILQEKNIATWDLGGIGEGDVCILGFIE